MEWRDSRGNQYSEASLIEHIKHRLSAGDKIFIGSDSHRMRKSKRIAVATALCFWSDDTSHGGWYVFKRQYLQKKEVPNLFSRLMYEAQSSIDAASYIRDTLGVDVDSIHVNINPKESEASSKYARQISGYVEACGFKCILKPDDWAAGSVADKHAR